eukprot:11167620-Lingulodinium_polyedra.AAC.1
MDEARFAPKMLILPTMLFMRVGNPMASCVCIWQHLVAIDVRGALVAARATTAQVANLAQRAELQQAGQPVERPAENA